MYTSRQKLSQECVINTNTLNLDEDKYFVKNPTSFNPNFLIFWYVEHEQKKVGKVNSDVKSIIKDCITNEGTAQKLFDRSIKTYEEVAVVRGQHGVWEYIHASEKIQQTLEATLEMSKYSKMVAQLIDGYLGLITMSGKYKSEDFPEGLVSDLSNGLRMLIVGWMMSKYHCSVKPKDVEVSNRNRRAPNKEYGDIVLGHMYEFYKEFREMGSKDEFKGMNNFFIGSDYSDGWMSQCPLILHYLLMYMQLRIDGLREEYIEELFLKF